MLNVTTGTRGAAANAGNNNELPGLASPGKGQEPQSTVGQPHAASNNAANQATTIQRVSGNRAINASTSNSKARVQGWVR